MMLVHSSNVYINEKQKTILYIVHGYMYTHTRTHKWYLHKHRSIRSGLEVYTHKIYDNSYNRVRCLGRGLYFYL